VEIKRIVSQYLDSNVFVVANGSNAIIIDSGVDCEAVKRVVAGKNVCGIFLTHGHYDHSLFALEYANRFNCKIYASKEIKDILADGYANYSEGKFTITDFSMFEFLSDGQAVRLGDFDVVAIETKGHSKDSMCYLIENVLFSGDTLFSAGIGRTDLISSSKEDMINSLEKIKKIEFDRVYHGHGECSTKQMQKKNIGIYLKFLLR